MSATGSIHFDKLSYEEVDISVIMLFVRFFTFICASIFLLAAIETIEIRTKWNNNPSGDD